MTLTSKILIEQVVFNLNKMDILCDEKSIRLSGYLQDTISNPTSAWFILIGFHKENGWTFIKPSKFGLKYNSKTKKIKNVKLLQDNNFSLLVVANLGRYNIINDKSSIRVFKIRTH